MFSLLFSFLWHLLWIVLFSIKSPPLERFSPLIPVLYLGGYSYTKEFSPKELRGGVIPLFQLPPMEKEDKSWLESGFLSSQLFASSSPGLKNIPLEEDIFLSPLDLEKRRLVFLHPSLPPFPKEEQKGKDNSLIQWEEERREVILKVLPQYPALAKKEDIEGEVVLNFLVNPEGRVVKVEVDKSSGYLPLDLSSSLSLYYWRFTSSKGYSKGKIKFIFPLSDE